MVVKNSSEKLGIFTSSKNSSETAEIGTKPLKNATEKMLSI